MYSELIKNKKRKTPIWFMRQAGRYLPEYREIRLKKRSFLDLCFSPQIASEISLQPIKRFDFDFIILFSDILVIPYALGQDVQFIENVGPKLGEIDFTNINNFFSTRESMNLLSPVFETLKILKKKKGEKKIIGFCGGPFTVLNYMIERGTSKKHEKIMDFLDTQKALAVYLIEKITEISIEYLIKQIESGADFIQIFDSWAGLLNDKQYEQFIIQPSRKINEEIKKKYPEIPQIFFPRGSKEKLRNFLLDVKCDVISVDEISEETKIFCMKKNIAIQGNLCPQTLLQGGQKLEKEVKNILERFKDNTHIFNLSHGILPKTPIENVQKVIDIVRKSYEFTNKSS
tara:strand:+ start:385 stop:1416 length:1032 start_codon:yes stop_codon:yes gene_type:complete